MYISVFQLVTNLAKNITESTFICQFYHNEHFQHFKCGKWKGIKVAKESFKKYS